MAQHTRLLAGGEEEPLLITKPVCAKNKAARYMVWSGVIRRTKKPAATKISLIKEKTFYITVL